MKFLCLLLTLTISSIASCDSMKDEEFQNFIDSRILECESAMHRATFVQPAIYWMGKYNAYREMKHYMESGEFDVFRPLFKIDGNDYYESR